MYGLDKRENGKGVNLFLILDNDTDNLRTGGVVSDVLNILPKLKRNGREHIFSVRRNIFTVEVEYKETISFSVSNPCCCKGLDQLG